MTEQNRPTSYSLPIVIAMCAGLMGVAGSCTSIVTTGVVAVRLFTQTEARVDEIDRRIGKVESLAAATADHFNGPARAEHQKLVGRVDLIDAEVKTKASHEGMQSLALEMRQQFAHVIGLLNEVRDDKRRKDQHQ